MNKLTCNVPKEPGVYLMKDENDRIIYVGKAKNLYKRISSYFRSQNDLKVKKMVSKVKNIDFIITNSEKEALILEANLIKKYKPKYNVYFRDDKQYLLFVLNKKEKYPSLKISRRFSKDDIVFGPFTSAYKARETMRIINKIFKLKKCNNKNFKNRVRPCLQYHLQRCFAPCCYKVDEKKYWEEVRKVELFLKGEKKDLINLLEKQMWNYANNCDFERAALLRDQIQAISSSLEKQVVVYFKNESIDVFYLKIHKENIYLSILYVREGRVIDKDNFNFSNIILKDKNELWFFILSQFYLFKQQLPAKIVVSEHIDSKNIVNFFKYKFNKDVKIMLPKNKDILSLLDIAKKNIYFNFKQKIKLYDCDLLNFIFADKKIYSIEAIDISHFYGQYTYLASIVFKGNKFIRDEYRLFKFDNINGNDFLPYKLFLQKKKEKRTWPDLFLIDGGKGHLQYFLKVLKEIQAPEDIEVLAIAKGSSRRLGNLDDKVYSKYEQAPLELKNNLLLFLQSLRDEAHRFVLQAQTKKYSKEKIDDILLKVKGIGPNTALNLWQKFKTLENILNASPQDLQKVNGIGPQKALYFYKQFNKVKSCLYKS
ncbi:excinuclease ABC subunit UvrC [Desulfonauticus submarinus]